MRTLILVFFVLASLFYFGTSKIEDMECQINQTPCSEEHEKEFSEFLGQNFFLLNPDKKIKEIKVSYSHWQKIRVKKVPFHKILIEITTRQPVACLLIKDKIFLLDREAVIVRETDVNPGLPEIETEKFKEEEVKKALEAVHFLNQYSLACKRIKIEAQNLILFFPETEVFLPTEDMSFKIASLQMILSQGKMEGKLPRKIDLKFKKPVITY